MPRTNEPYKPASEKRETSTGQSPRRGRGKKKKKKSPHFGLKKGKKKSLPLCANGTLGGCLQDERKKERVIQVVCSDTGRLTTGKKKKKRGTGAVQTKGGEKRVCVFTLKPLPKRKGRKKEGGKGAAPHKKKEKGGEKGFQKPCHKKKSPVRLVVILQTTQEFWERKKKKKKRQKYHRTPCVCSEKKTANH